MVVGQLMEVWRGTISTSHHHVEAIGGIQNKLNSGVVINTISILYRKLQSSIYRNEFGNIEMMKFLAQQQFIDKNFRPYYIWAVVKINRLKLIEDPKE